MKEIEITKVFDEYLQNKINYKQAILRLGISKAVFFKKVKIYKAGGKQSVEPKIKFKAKLVPTPKYILENPHAISIKDFCGLLKLNEEIYNFGFAEVADYSNYSFFTNLMNKKTYSCFKLDESLKKVVYFTEATRNRVVNALLIDLEEEPTEFTLKDFKNLIIISSNHYEFSEVKKMSGIHHRVAFSNYYENKIKPILEYLNKKIDLSETKFAMKQTETVIPKETEASKYSGLIAAINENSVGNLIKINSTFLTVINKIKDLKTYEHLKILLHKVITEGAIELSEKDFILITKNDFSEIFEINSNKQLILNPIKINQVVEIPFLITKNLEAAKVFDLISSGMFLYKVAQFLNLKKEYCLTLLTELATASKPSMKINLSKAQIVELNEFTLSIQKRRVSLCEKNTSIFELNLNYFKTETLADLLNQLGLDITEKDFITIPEDLKELIGKTIGGYKIQFYSSETKKFAVLDVDKNDLVILEEKEILELL